MYLLEYFAVVVVMATALAKDLTMTPDEKGADVVAAVVDRIRNQCLLPDDRFLLRRLAYVESLDGETSRTMFNGGIWNVDESMFNETRFCNSPIHYTCDLIQSALGIDWKQVNWYDLRKPMYSGLAASLYILAQNEIPLPSNTSAQAKFWVEKYKKDLSLDKNAYIRTSQEIKAVGCSEQLDLAFILDGSGSIQVDEFDQVRNFIKNISDDFEISRTGVQVALVEFSERVGDVVYLNSTHDRASLKQAVMNITKSGHTTNTAAALDVATQNVFTSVKGARADAKHVIVLLTDGASGDSEKTKAAAARAKDKGIIVFSVGVGFVNEDELETVASEPNCTHFYKLGSFGEIDNLVYEIKRRTCEAPKIIAPTDGEETPNKVTTPLKDDPVKTTFVLNTTGDGQMDKYIKAEVDCGILRVYASYNTSSPSPAFYDVSSLASDGRVSITKVNVTKKGRPLYVTVIGTKLEESCSDVLKCQDAKFTVSVVDKPPQSDVSVICRTWEGDRACTQRELVQKGFLIPSCPTAPRATPLTNPCTAQAISDGLMIQPHPYDATKFIVCDVTGEMYPTNCPRNGIFNPMTLTCNNKPIFSLERPVTTPDTSLNFICLFAGAKWHFPYPGDETKFIQCSPFHVAYVRDCGAGTVYNDQIQNCAYVTSDPVDIISAQELCSNANPGAMLAYPNDEKQYIHCAPFRPYVQSCPLGTRWDDDVKACGY